MRAETLRTLSLHALFLCVVLGLWEWGARAGWVDPSFMGSPLGIIQFTLENLANARLWGDLGYTLLAVFASFVIGSVAAMITGLAFVTWPKFEAFCDPYVSAFNVLPRIALVPLFILWFGLGVGSKIALGVSLTFFIVLSSTVAGIRGVSQDHVTLTRTLGASSTEFAMRDASSAASGLSAARPNAPSQAGASTRAAASSERCASTWARRCCSAGSALVSGNSGGPSPSLCSSTGPRPSTCARSSASLIASISRSIVFISGMCGVLVLRTRFLNGGLRRSHAGIPANGAASS